MPEEENVIAEGKQSIAIGGQVTDSKINSGDAITEQRQSNSSSHTTNVNISPFSSPSVVPERKLRFLLLLKPCLKWLLLLLPSAGIAITVHFAILRQWGAAFASLSITVILTLFILVGKFIVELINRLSQRWEAEQQQLAVRFADTIWSQLEVWLWEFTSPFQRKYYQSLIYACQDYRTQGLKTKGPFTLDFEKVFVPLRVAPECVEQIGSAMIQSRVRADTPKNIWECLEASKNYSTYRSIAIIGPPGSGKTTLLEHLTLTYAKNAQRWQHRQAPKLIPILLYLRDIQDTITSAQTQPRLSSLIEGQESVRQMNPPPQWFERKLHRQQCLVMLDGLDEVADSQQRQSISRWVNQQIQKYPNARFILTSRPFGYRNAQVQEVKTILEVQPFNLEQIQTFIQYWYLQHEIMSRLGKDNPGVRQAAEIQSNDLIKRIKNNPPLTAMAINPLLLTMIATVHRFRGALPGRRVELYAEICDVLLGKRQEAKGITEALTAEKKKVVLQVLALELMERNTREFTPELGTSLIQGELIKVAGNNLKAEEFLNNIENLSGLLIEREKDLYEFSHKSFQEYLAAVQIKETNQESILIENINNPWWEETIRLYAAQSDVTNLITAALNSPTVISLKLAYDCLEESLRVTPEVREHLKDRLEDGVESTDSEVAKLAAQVKLARRLNKLLRLNNNLEIDTSYITNAEYQLFIDEQLKTGKKWSAGNAKKPMTEISFQEAKRFCVWLSLKAPLHKDSESAPHFYRLLTASEARMYSAIEPERLVYWSGSNCDKGSGICVVKEKVSSPYIQLFNHLAVGEWDKADLETASIMLRLAKREEEGWLDIESLNKFPSEELCTIDWLWVTYSDGHFGFSVQKRIWESIRKELKNDEVNYDIYKIFGEHLGWCVKDNWLTYNDLSFSLTASQGHLPYPNKTYSRQIWRSKAWESFLVLIEREWQGC